MSEAAPASTPLDVAHPPPLTPYLSPVAPRIMVAPKPTVTDIGSDVTLTCMWSGNPPLTLTWTKKESNMVGPSQWGSKRGHTPFWPL